MMNTKSLAPLLSIMLCLAISSRVEAQVKLSGAQQLSTGIGGAAPAGSSGSPIIGPNGKFLVFRSDASNLLASDTDNVSDIYIRSIDTGALSLASVNSSEVKGNNDSTQPTLTPVGPDGFYAVAFVSSADNLSTVTDSLGFDDIFVRFPKTGFTLPVTLGNGNQIADDNSNNPSATITVAPNKVLVAFASAATNLVSTDSNNRDDIFLATITPPSNSSNDPATLVSRVRVLGPAGVEPNNHSETPQISGDGRFIVFVSRATNFISGRTTSGRQIFLYDVASGAVSLLSQTSGGIEGNDDSTSPRISYSGRYVVFLTQSDNIVPDVGPGDTALVMLDRNTGTFSRVNASSDGVAGNQDANDPSITPNGRFVTFSDNSDNLLGPGVDTNGVEDVFVKDIATGLLSRVSNPVSGDADGDSDTTYTSARSFNSLSGLISFRSFASNLTSSDSGGTSNVFLTGAGLSTPTLTKQTRLETPADVRVSGKTSRIAVQKFTLTSAASALVPRSFEGRATKRSIKYDIRINGTGKRRNERFRFVSSRNSATQRNLKPGVYASKYRVITQQGNKNVAATPFSPRMKFQVR